MNNIAFLLLLDVVRFYKLENTTHMRYRDETRLFWRTGFQMFHGRFLRFMGGPKSQGQITDHSGMKGKYCPSDAKINFAVPDTKCLKTNQEVSEEIKPGILHECMSEISKVVTDVKVAFDAKKINSGLSAHDGDIDLFGCEEAPTLRENLERKNSELEEIEDLLKKSEDCNLSPDDIKKCVLMISFRIKDLKHMAAYKTEGVKKFKELGQPDWRASKYSYVISSMQCSLIQIEQTIEKCLGVNDRLCQIMADLNGTSHIYTLGSKVNLDQQENYVCISAGLQAAPDKNEISLDKERYVLKQRSEKWFEVRESAKVTGSSAHKALGLDTLKKQQQFMKSGAVGFQQQQQHLSTDVQKAMQHGCDNEVNAIATLSSKVLPAFYPSLLLIEEGCIMIKHEGHPFLAVSPDGSIRPDVDSQATMGVEVKCPFGDKKNMHLKCIMHSLIIMSCRLLLKWQHCNAKNCCLFLTQTKAAAFSKSRLMKSFGQIFGKNLSNCMERIQKPNISQRD